MFTRVVFYEQDLMAAKTFKTKELAEAWCKGVSFGASEFGGGASICDPDDPKSVKAALKDGISKEELEDAVSGAEEYK